MNKVILLLPIIAACSADARTDQPQDVSSAVKFDTTPSPADAAPPTDAESPDGAYPLDCPTCAPPHVPGMLRCDELDTLVQPTCKAFEEACVAPSCPVDWPIPIARHYLTPQRAGCLNSNAGLFACKVPGMNNTVFIDCCAVDVTATAPTCSIDSDCPHPIAECWDAWCNAAGICGADKAKTHGTPCSIGHCESGQCVP